MTIHKQNRQRIGDIAKVISGYAFKSEEFGDSGIPVIKIKNVRKGFVDLSDSQRVPQHFMSLDKKYHVKSKDLLISLTGSHLTQPDSVVGRVALQSKSAELCLLNQRAGRFIIKDTTRCNKIFLYYTLSTNENARSIALMAHGAANQANVSPSQVESLELWLPDITIQNKIASILSAYDDLIENNLKRIKILAEMAQMIYREWFVNFHFAGYEKVRMVKSELGMIPEGWKVKRLGEILKKLERKPRIKKEAYLEQGAIPCIDQGMGFIGGYTNNESALHLTPLPIIVFGDHTRIVKYIDFPFASGADGTQLLYPTNEDLVPAYFYYAIKNIDLSNFAYARHFKFLKEQNILIPASINLQSFNEVVGLLLNQMSTLNKKNNNLRKTRDLLLPKLISNELDVTAIDFGVDS